MARAIRAALLALGVLLLPTAFVVVAVGMIVDSPKTVMAAPVVAIVSFLALTLYSTTD